MACLPHAFALNKVKIAPDGATSTVLAPLPRRGPARVAQVTQVRSMAQVCFFSSARDSLR